MGALAGTAAGLCAGTCLFHLPPLGERRFIHRLQAETFPLTFVKCLEQTQKGTLDFSELFTCQRTH